MIRIILYNCGLQLLSSLPKTSLQHPSIVSDMKKRRKTSGLVLLDYSIHQEAIPDAIKENIGRPEIIHHSVVNYLYSNVFAVWKNEIQLIIHTVENKYFTVLNQWNPPLSFNRFRGLMEHLLTKGRLKTNAGLIKLKSGSLLDILKLEEEKKQERKVIALTRYGKKDTFLDFQQKILKYTNSKTEYILLIGGYQKGPNPKEIDHKIDEKIAITDEKLPSFKLINLLTSGLEFSEYFNNKFEFDNE
ncbi:MAG: hypothetical protein ACW967_05590 [Candidatus Hodarchaeales archaeon]|jgi:rRNA pseudouridine-1189 N-methylase Emg1 (Nep1/Mra1 family)